MATAVVTGGAGFLGSHLCDFLLRDGYRVVCIDNLDTLKVGSYGTHHMLGLAKFGEATAVPDARPAVGG